MTSQDKTVTAVTAYWRHLGVYHLLNPASISLKGITRKRSKKAEHKNCPTHPNTGTDNSV